MTAADKLRELLATRPAMPNTEELVRWWRTSAGLVRQVLDEHETVAAELEHRHVEARRLNQLLVAAQEQIERAKGPQW